MRNETLLKVIIAVFAIVLIVLATFVYGNVQRSKQKSSSSNNQASVQPPANSPDKSQSNNQQQASPKPTTPPATTPTPAPSAPVAPTQPATSNIPATGASDAVIPMTILSVLAYLYFKSSTRNSSQIVSKSTLH